MSHPSFDRTHTLISELSGCICTKSAPGFFESGSSTSGGRQGACAETCVKIEKLPSRRAKKRKDLTKVIDPRKRDLFQVDVLGVDATEAPLESGNTEAVDAIGASLKCGDTERVNATGTSLGSDNTDAVVPTGAVVESSGNSEAVSAVGSVLESGSTEETGVTKVSFELGNFEAIDAMGASLESGTEGVDVTRVPLESGNTEEVDVTRVSSESGNAEAIDAIEAPLGSGGTREGIEFFEDEGTHSNSGVISGDKETRPSIPRLLWLGPNETCEDAVHGYD